VLKHAENDRISAMAVLIFRKKYKLRFLISLVFMIGSLFLLNYLFRGPRLGFFYDFLMKYRRPSSISPELTLIETGFIPENGERRGGSAGVSVTFFLDKILSGNLVPVTMYLTTKAREVQKAGKSRLHASFFALCA
jgi:hypothetical protein